MVVDDDDWTDQKKKKLYEDNDNVDEQKNSTNNFFSPIVKQIIHTQKYIIYIRVVVNIVNIFFMIDNFFKFFGNIIHHEYQ